MTLSTAPRIDWNHVSFSHGLFSKTQNHKNPKGKAGNDPRNQSIITFYMEGQSHRQIRFFFSDKENLSYLFNPATWGALVLSGRASGTISVEVGEGFPGESDGDESACIAWRIPWTEELGGLQSMGLPRVRYNWVTITFSKTPWYPYQPCSSPFYTVGFWVQSVCESSILLL